MIMITMITLETTYRVLRSPVIEVFMPIVEQITRTKEFVIHHLVLDLNHLDRGF